MKLTAEEREVILTWNDADRYWHVYSDSSVLKSAILDLAQRAGVTPEPVAGGGIEFDLPAGRSLHLPAPRDAKPPPPPEPARKMLPVAGLREAVGAK